jgi:hypothetical protein
MKTLIVIMMLSGCGRIDQAISEAEATGTATSTATATETKTATDTATETGTDTDASQNQTAEGKSVIQVNASGGSVVNVNVGESERPQDDPCVASVLQEAAVSIEQAEVACAAQRGPQ